MKDKRTQELIDTDVATAQALGGKGTPFNVIIFPDGTYETVAGALPYNQWQVILQSYGQS